MSRRCDICGRGSKKVIRRSHSKRATISRQFLNLQNRMIDGQRCKVCTGCLKTAVKKKTALRVAR
ncbi:50S ribosomal protein L28 [Candidatus Falkowbacteria bacterium]|nr:50S ribosomal protein L28 [Candidatus Falkowbacteria bacterium]